MVACAPWNRCAWRSPTHVGSDMTPTTHPSRRSRPIRAHQQGTVHRQGGAREAAGAGVPNRFVTLEVHGVTDADPLGKRAAVQPGGRVTRRATSGYYGHCLRKSLAIGLHQGRVRQRARSLRSRSWANASRRRCCASRPTTPTTLSCGLIATQIRSSGNRPRPVSPSTAQRRCRRAHRDLPAHPRQLRSHQQ